MREQLNPNERRGMKLIGIGRQERQDRTRPPEPPTCGCEYVETTTYADAWPTYVVTELCPEHLDKLPIVNGRKADRQGVIR